jgi:hypothetical protein
MPQVSSIFDGLLPDLKQSQRAMQRASMGIETLDLSPFEPEVKEAAVAVSEEGRGIRELLIDASMELQALKQNLASKVADPSSPGSNKNDRELKLLRWEVSLAMGNASRGIDAIRRLLNDDAYWSLTRPESP